MEIISVLYGLGMFAAGAYVAHMCSRRVFYWPCAINTHWLILLSPYQVLFLIQRYVAEHKALYKKNPKYFVRSDNTDWEILVKIDSEIEKQTEKEWDGN